MAVSNAVFPALGRPLIAPCRRLVRGMERAEFGHTLSIT